MGRSGWRGWATIGSSVELGAWSRAVASSAMLGWSNRVRSGTSRSRAARMRVMARVASRECPPRSKKSSWIPGGVGRSRTWA